MPKRKERSAEEYWRGKYREVSRENKSLKKRLKQLEQKEHIFDDRSQDEEVSGDTEDTFVEIPKAIRCTSESCGKGHYKLFEIMGKVIGTCDVCGDRRKLK